MIEQALFEYLNSELITSAYYINAPQGAALPRIIMTPISDNRQYDTELRRARVQITVWDADKYNGLTIRESVYDVLQRFKGRMGGVAITAIAQDAITINNTEFDGSTELYQYITDYFVTYRGED